MKRTLLIIGLILLVVLLLSRPLERATGNEYYISKMDASVQKQVRRFLEDIEKRGFTPVIRDSTRTYKQQVRYKKQDSRNANPGTSSHEKGLAIDVDVYKDGKVLSKRTAKSEWIKSGVPALAEIRGIKWGGNFKTYPDNNHFYF